MTSKANVQCYTIRLLPGQDLREGIEEFVEKKNLEGAFIMTCVGSIESATLRFPIPKTGHVPAMNRELTYKKEYFDILSLVGTVSLGGCHLHVVLGRADGTVLGGHLVGNAKVHTTAEVVIGESLQEVYVRKNDPKTTFNELEVKPR
uniref:PPC domain-containing protein n=1 Tax=Graphocephala atropunctata TaxID=36148 RepID=A0A1B6MV68_9HEMI